jgi:hypothetical protein
MTPEQRAQLQKMGIAKTAAKAKYPTPEIHMVSNDCLLPGGIGEVVVRGKFVPGTSIILENDNLEVLKETLAGNEYRAMVKVAAGIGPQTASVMAITPVTGITARVPNGPAVGGRYEWTLETGNGWRIVARSAAGQACGGQRGEDKYELLFYKKGEANPFEKRAATLYYSMYERTNHRFNISQEDPAAGAATTDMMTLMKKLGDPNLPDAERQRLMKQMEQQQAQMIANMKKMSDPAQVREREARNQQFGCAAIQMEVNGGNVKGEMRCAQAVGMRIPVTGSMKLTGR